MLNKAVALFFVMALSSSLFISCKKQLFVITPSQRSFYDEDSDYNNLIKIVFDTRKSEIFYVSNMGVYTSVESGGLGYETQNAKLVPFQGIPIFVEASDLPGPLSYSLSYGEGCDGVFSLSHDKNFVLIHPPAKKLDKAMVCSVSLTVKAAGDSISLTKSTTVILNYTFLQWCSLNHPTVSIIKKTLNTSSCLDVAKMLYHKKDLSLNHLQPLQKSSAIKKGKVDTLPKISDEHLIYDLSPLSGMNHLVSLDLTGHRISDLTLIKYFHNLENLVLSHNKIFDVFPLKFLVHLKSLDLSYNNIFNVYSIKGLVNLKYLNLSHNHISNLRPLKKLSSLTTLMIANNVVSDISTLTHLPKLAVLDLKGNPLKRIHCLEQTEDFPVLKRFCNAIDID